MFFTNPSKIFQLLSREFILILIQILQFMVRLSKYLPRADVPYYPAANFRNEDFLLSHSKYLTSFIGG